MLVVKISIAKVRAAAAHCAKKEVSPFSLHRVLSSFDWIPERQRFAFGAD